jgi:glycosyltransferase involved in cell wall biosynthesis
MKTPRISVITAVYNGSKYLAQTIDSVLAQSFGDFEYILVDDGSTDNSKDVIASFNDPRIKVISHDRNYGLVAARNTAISHARGELIALTDQDDVSKPERFERQVAFLDAHPAIALAATWEIEVFEATGLEKVKKFRDYADFELSYALLFRNPLGNSTLMFRRSKVQTPAYALNYPLCEDYNFIAKMSWIGGVALMQEKLVMWRDHGANYSTQKASEMQQYAIKLQGELLERLGVPYSDAQLKFHHSIAVMPSIDSLVALDLASDWLSFVHKEARIEKDHVDSFRNALSAEWFDCAQRAAHLGMETWKIYQRSELSSHPRIGFVEKLKLWAKCLLKR